MNLKGRHILVTGAGKRVGRHIAEAFVREGCHLTAHGHHSKDDVEDLVRWAQQESVAAHAVYADLSSREQIASAVEDSVSKLGPIDILVNSASIFFSSPVESVTDEQWDRLFDINLKGQFHFAREMAKRLPEDRKGVVLNIGDVNGVRSFLNYAPYSALKAGLIHLTKGLARELAPRIRVNALSPGWVLTPEGTSAEQVERNAEKTLLKRIGEPADVVNGLLFLAKNDYITGFNLIVDGGRAIL